MKELALDAVSTGTLDEEMTLPDIDLARLVLSRSALIRALARAFTRLTRR